MHYVHCIEEATGDNGWFGFHAEGVPLKMAFNERELKALIERNWDAFRAAQEAEMALAYVTLKPGDPLYDALERKT